MKCPIPSKMCIYTRMRRVIGLQSFLIHVQSFKGYFATHPTALSKVLEGSEAKAGDCADAVSSACPCQQMLERNQVYGHNGPLNCKAVEEKFVSTLLYPHALSYGKINPIPYPCCYNYGAETGIILFTNLIYLLALGVPFKKKR